MTLSEQTIERVARESYGRLVAFLAARSNDVATAEDALGEAFARALDRWPIDGVPTNPEAWLLTAARRKLIDEQRRSQTRVDALPALATLRRVVEDAVEETKPLPDERVGLLFVCAHPSIDPAARTPLMLQAVLGLNAAEIASAFLTTPSTMSQRLVRAKTKIRDARISFRIPDAEEWPDRLDAVLEAIYAAFGLGWESVGDGDAQHEQLTQEAIWLGRIVTQLLPDAAEALGLLALMLFCESRRKARRSPEGEYVPLSEQNTNLWDHAMIREAEELLFRAAKLRNFGHFQTEAAIQSAHAERRFTGTTNWPAIASLYRVLISMSPSVGAMVGHAAAVAEAEGDEAGLALLDAIDAKAIAAYQPYWALRGHLLARLGNISAAREANERAIGLTEDECLRRYLLQRMQNQ